MRYSDSSQKKPRYLSSRQPGYLECFKTRGFPSPPHDEFGFIFRIPSDYI